MIFSFVLFGMTVDLPEPDKDQNPYSESFVPPWYLNSDSIKYGFSHTVLQYTFGEKEVKSDTNEIITGFEDASNQNGLINDHIELQYNPRTKIIYHVTFYINLEDTLVSSTDIDKLVTFASYFDKNTGKAYKKSLPLILRTYPAEEEQEITIPDKKLHFEITQNLTVIKQCRETGRKPDLKGAVFYIAFTVNNREQSLF